MKKLLALLLAMLLPLSGFAETYVFSVSVEADEEAFVQLAKEALASDPSVAPADTESYAKLIHQVLNGLGLNAAFQENAMSLELLLGGGKLLDFAAYESQQEVNLTSTMLPGYALVSEMNDQGSSEQALLDDLAETDWAAICEGVMRGLQEWYAVIEPSVSRGAFDGDAFEGGTRCTTWMLSDMDIAALANALLTDEVREVLSVVMTALALDAEKMLAQFDELNDKVADEDRYLYLFRVVRDDADRLVGMSLTILQENDQVVTVSLGIKENEARLVAGLGLNKQNYWWEFTASHQQEDDVTRLSGISREWVADKADGFSYVRAEMEPAFNIDWQCNVTKSGNGCTWDAIVTSGETCIASSYGTTDLDKSSLEYQFGIGDAAASPLTVKLSICPTDAIPSMADGLTRCSISDPADAKTYDQLVKQLAASFLARLMKLLPMDMLMTMNEVTLP